MDSDAARLASIRALSGGISVFGPHGAFCAIFDRQYSSAGVGDLEMESRSPALTCRSIDVEDLTKDETVTVEGRDFRVLRREPDSPSPGFTVLILRA